MNLEKSIRRALKKGYPPYITWYATRRCNCQCTGCSVQYDIKSELSLEQVNNLAHQFADMGIAIVGVQGGEPLLRKDIYQCLEIFHKIGIRTGLVTNGTMGDTKLFDDMLDYGIAVCISLDTLKPYLYRRIRGLDALSKVQNLLEQISVKLRRRACVHMTVSALNADEIFDIAQYVNGLGYPLSILPVVGGVTMRHRRQDDELISKNNRSVIVKAVQKVIDNYDDYWFLVSQDVLEAAVKYLIDGSLDFCGAAHYSLTIDSDGSVSPCPDLPSFGNVLESTLKAIWDRRYLIRSQITDCLKNTPCFYGCTVGKYISFRQPDGILMNLERMKYGLSS